MEQKNPKIFFEQYTDIVSTSIRTEDIVRTFYEFNYLKFIDEKFNFNYLKNTKDDEVELFINYFSKQEHILDKKYKQILEAVIDDLKILVYTDLKLSKVIDLLNSYDLNTIKEIVSENIAFNDSRIFDIYSSSNELSELIGKILKISPEDKVIDLCSGTGNFLTYTFNKFKAKNLTGIEINKNQYLISEIKLSILECEYNLRNEDVLKSQINEKYDKIFSEFPAGLRVDKYDLDYIYNANNLMFNWNKLPANSTDWLFVNVALSIMKDNGKIAVSMPNGPLFKDADIQFKKEFIDKGYIEAIIKLPGGLIYPTGIGSNLVILSKNNKSVSFIDATKALKTNKFDVEQIVELYNTENNNKKCVSIKEIQEKEYNLVVNNYVGIKEIKYFNPHILGEYVIDVFRGYQVTSEIKKLENPNGECELLTISDIDKGVISDKLCRLDYNKKIERYFIKENDIVISSKGTRIKVAVANNIKNRKIIANGNLIVLRVDDKKINPNYLAMFLNTNDGKETLKQIQTGTVIFSINPRKLLNIKISVVEKEKQDKIAKKFISKQQQVILAREHLQKLEFELENSYEEYFERLFD